MSHRLQTMDTQRRWQRQQEQMAERDRARWDEERRTLVQDLMRAMREEEDARRRRITGVTAHRLDAEERTTTHLDDETRHDASPLSKRPRDEFSNSELSEGECSDTREHPSHPTDDEEDDEGDVSDEPEPEPSASIPSPPDDQGQFAALLQRAAAKFDIQLETHSRAPSYLTSKLGPALQSAQLLPLDPHIWELGKEHLKRPASAPQAGHRQERKYRAPLSDPLFLRAQPQPDSIILAAGKRKQHQSQGKVLTPSERENKRLEAAGKKMCACASMAIREANTTAILTRYDREMWDAMEDYIHHLPDEHKQGAANIVAEGRLVSNHVLKTALDSADTGFRTLAVGITQRRTAWLQDSVFKQDMQARLADMPFDGEKLFGKEVKETVTDMKGDLDSVRAVTGSTYKGYPRSQKPQNRRQQSGRDRADRSWPSTSTGKNNSSSRGSFKKRGSFGGRGRGAPRKDKD